MPRFVDMIPDEFHVVCNQVKDAWLNTSIPWENPSYQVASLPRTFFDRQQSMLLGYMLNPEQSENITDGWLLGLGAEQTNDHVPFIFYRFHLPVIDDARRSYDYEGVGCYFELAPDLAGPGGMLDTGWFGLLRTASERNMQGTRPALIASRKFRTQADVVMFLYLLGAWPYQPPLESNRVATHPPTTSLTGSYEAPDDRDTQPDGVYPDPLRDA